MKCLLEFLPLVANRLFIEGSSIGTQLDYNSIEVNF